MFVYAVGTGAAMIIVVSIFSPQSLPLILFDYMYYFVPYPKRKAKGDHTRCALTDTEREIQRTIKIAEQGHQRKKQYHRYAV